MAIETWFQMEDGSVGDPRDILTGEDGKLRHKDGRAVAYGPYGPRSRGGVDPEKERAKAAKPKVDIKVEVKAEHLEEAKLDEAKSFVERDWTKPVAKEPSKSDREMRPKYGRQSYKTR